MVMLAVEITNLGPDKRAHGRERGAIVAVYGGKRQQAGRAGLRWRVLAVGCGRANWCREPGNALRQRL